MAHTAEASRLTGIVMTAYACACVLLAVVLSANDRFRWFPSIAPGPTCTWAKPPFTPTVTATPISRLERMA